MARAKAIVSRNHFATGRLESEPRGGPSLTPLRRRLTISSRHLTPRRCLLSSRSNTGHRNAMIRPSLKPGIAHPITPGGIDVRVCRRLDLLAVRSDLLEAPVTLPVIAASDIGRMRRWDRRHAVTAVTVIAGATAPLSIEDLECPQARHGISILRAKFGDLSEAIIAGPTLLAGTGVRIRRDFAMGLLGRSGTRPRHRADEYHPGQGECSLGCLNGHTIHMIGQVLLYQNTD